MLTKSQNYNSILSNPLHYAESILVTSSHTYTEANMMSLSVSQSLYGDEYSIGGVVMNQLDFTLVGVGVDEFPKYTRVEVWTRLTDGTDYTNWLPKGVFYTRKPAYDPVSDMLTVTAYDEMFKTEQIPFEMGSTVTTFSNPSLREVATHLVEGTDVSGKIASNWPGIGVTLEDATQVSNSLTMSAVPYGYTVREVLSDIATACGGNWTMCFSNTGTDENKVQAGKLRLIGGNSLPPETFYLITMAGEPITFGGDRILTQ